jgi:uncharacterized protein DUF6799
MDIMHDDHLVMQGSRVMIMRGGQMRPMDEEMTLPDGTKIMVDGTVMMPDGTTRMMAEGETMLLQGTAADPEDMTDRQFKEAMEDEELRDELP